MRCDKILNVLFKSLLVVVLIFSSTVSFYFVLFQFICSTVRFARSFDDSFLAHFFELLVDDDATAFFSFNFILSLFLFFFHYYCCSKIHLVFDALIHIANFQSVCVCVCLFTLLLSHSLCYECVSCLYTFSSTKMIF